jgi:hypothetical protein
LAHRISQHGVSEERAAPLPWRDEFGDDAVAVSDKHGLAAASRTYLLSLSFRIFKSD